MKLVAKVKLLLKMLPTGIYQQTRQEILLEAGRQFLQKLLESVTRGFSAPTHDRRIVFCATARKKITGVITVKVLW